MANIDKQSVRDEVDKIKAEYEVLCAANKVPAETRMLVASMLMIIELILSIFLERKTKKTSKNSSLPPSQTGEDNSSLPGPGGRSKGKAENRSKARNSRTHETVSIVTVPFCEDCGEDLQGVAAHEYERRTRIDIIFEKVVEHVDAEIKHCPACDAVNKGAFPSDLHGPLQYGPGLKAFIINLLVGQMVAMSRTQKLVKAMIGTVVAEASMLKFILRLHQSLEVWEQSAIEQLLKAPAMNVDETSFRADGKNHWIHVYSAGDITLKCLHRNRGKKAIEAINIIPRYGGVIIHDCWASYLSYLHCGHGLCGSHLLRELTFIVDSNGYPWARDMKKLLQTTCKTVSSRKEKCLDAQEFSVLQDRYRRIIAEGEKQLPAIGPRPTGKRGKLAKSDAHNLWERLKRYENAVLLFAQNPHVPFTNNRAERDLRMAKVKQKVSGCFRTLVYAEAYCRISSYLQTMANRGYNPLLAIQLALAGKAEEMGGE